MTTNFFFSIWRLFVARLRLFFFPKHVTVIFPNNVVFHEKMASIINKSMIEKAKQKSNMERHREVKTKQLD